MRRKIDAERMSLPDHEVVVYLRKAHVASPNARPFWQREEFDVLAKWSTAEHETSRLTNVTMTDHRAGTAFAYHVRRSWDPAVLGSFGRSAR